MTDSTNQPERFSRTDRSLHLAAVGGMGAPDPVHFLNKSQTKNLQPTEKVQYDE